MRKLAPSIKVDEARIDTVSVAVHVIRIGGKEMTLSVFRQLPMEPLVDPNTGELAGIPWGRVNYHWGCNMAGTRVRFGAPGTENHVHVVWQKGDELRHAVVYRGEMHRWPEQYQKLLELPQLFIAV
ncbi:hypothetical protein SAMN00808754_1446 [Thermanaeromonas toyohensis ToBE]|uniref:Uncharacterized protein n=1 Tax=Thermanaeromonas toyohensis ToBE TaxID=698762 RepID=A0A1W1VSV5_9FIRM|nr:hypothetical protein [Thermanaeromonas toyohensis]SMB96310.1 hypothetical protein SAMN00808754_1446 [Thermanaeromonas toyohensis ToBE]